MGTRLQPLLRDSLVVQRGGDRLQVGPRAEGLIAGSGEHEYPRLVVALEVAVGLEQLVRRIGIDRVAPLGPVDGEHPGGAAPLIGDLGHMGDPIRGSAGATAAGTAAGRPPWSRRRAMPCRAMPC